MDTDTPHIVQLASRIAANTTKLNTYIEAHHLPTPSFDVNGPKDTLVPKEEKDVEAARVAIIDDTQELRRLVLGPREYLMSYTHNELTSQQAITRFRIAHSFPVGSEASFEKIAVATGLNKTNVRQIVRHAVVKDIFAEPRPGVITHNAVSRLLAEDQVIHDWVGASTDDLWQAASQACNAIEKFPGSQEANETGFSLANQTSETVYQVFSKFPERARRFGNAMRSFTEGTGFELSHIVDNFPWEDLGKGVVVDVGGSQGFVCFALARKFSSLSFVVQDLEPVIESAKEHVPADVASRVTFMAHDFLTEQPVYGDVYFFRWILHNWSDKYCVQILRNLVPVLKAGSKIVLNDNVLPAPGVMSKWQEERLRSMDLTMTELQNSHERELEDWARVFELADPRFKFQGGKQPAGSNLWLLVAEWKGDE
ncbi:S-adenosyl-L-methionine-dependent methyltransferase [Hypoxylon rubiginosum]|uniref:S-adenosyl-L-methionine-dependent methyltransferase n=1 Tax=Hypoxylon rubiginosum TaxID=110542 RepID=A0ACC0DD60_9PEZI|nr:S-adenosyl-L-methionine-dependent methyltransferase [Hypoxylon rubiginosum]